MNEGESAGGGYPGFSPIPPAVTDRRSNLPTATNSNSLNQSAPSIITIVTTNGGTLPTHTTTTTALSAPVVSNKPRSFQQVFSQQQKQLSPVPTKKSAQQPSQAQEKLHMPQTVPSSRLSTGVAEGQAVTATDYNCLSVRPRSTFPLYEDQSRHAKRPKIDVAPQSVVGGVVGNVSGSLLPVTGATQTKPVGSPLNPQQYFDPQKYDNLFYSVSEHLKEVHTEYVPELYALERGMDVADMEASRPIRDSSSQYIRYISSKCIEVLGQSHPTQKLVQVNIAEIIGVTKSENSAHLQQPAAIFGGLNKSNTQSQSSSSSSSVTTAAAHTPISSSAVATTSGALSGRSSSHITPADASDKCLPQGAEIKIPAVGATPVAVSTKLPAAVVQLTQQGHIPGRPLGGRHGMVFGQITAPTAVGNSSIPLVPGGTPLVPCATTAVVSSGFRRNANGLSTQPLATSAGGQNSGNANATNPPPLYTPPNIVLVPASANSGGASSSHEFSHKAKQEVYVMQRVSELQKEGLWTEKRLPKQQEPSRTKAHWDYLLEEMAWLAADFAQERKWKKNAAKKCAKMVQRHFQDKANAAAKAEKAQEANLKRIAAFIAKEIKMFWSNVEKLVEFKNHSKIEEKRKKALDQHLSLIVDQTEKFSQQLVEGMNKSMLDTAASASGAHSLDSSRVPSPKHKAEAASDDEFRPETASEDDEETIAKAEEEAADVNEEVAALAKESEMDLDDFINELPAGYLENRDKLLEQEKFSQNVDADPDVDVDDIEFEANEPSEDDENTISKQEAEEMDVDHKRELVDLEADNNLTVEELMERYAEQTSTSAKNDKPSKMELDSDDDEPKDSDDESTCTEEDDSDDEALVSTSSEDGDNDEQEDGLRSLLEDNENSSSKDNMIKDAAALAESIQPKGNTLSSTNVVTPVPFLLKHSLREYQHIGLDWLVTMNERKLNGILADEMGLGKTIQTIALLAHLACVKGNWGPHLIVVPSSVMLNWEMEFKKWCPGFKILTYYGSQKERKLKRVGWTKPNAFHVCITSYKLVVQDQQSFRRKKWKYLILDEAQNIKNFKSQRWQLLLNFSTERRLLLTGTPLQNDLMELWSLMHFLMPYVFSSHREFKEWFSNPMTGMIEGNLEINESLINRLHKVIRPFLLRRLKKEVEKQMPSKTEHVVYCRLSNRQRYLYDDFMSRAKTRETLQTGNLLNVINVLMQLRKVCNHPNMFEVRPTISPFQMEGIIFHTAGLVCDVLQYHPLLNIDLNVLNLNLLQLEFTLPAATSHKLPLVAAPRQLIEEIDTLPQPPPPCPRGECRVFIRINKPEIQENLRKLTTVRVGASPAMKTEGNQFVPKCNLDKSRISKTVNSSINPVNVIRPKETHDSESTTEPNVATLTRSHAAQQSSVTGCPPAKIRRLSHSSGKPCGFSSGSGIGNVDARSRNAPINAASVYRLMSNEVKSKKEKTRRPGSDTLSSNEDPDASDPVFRMAEILQKRKERRQDRLKAMATINQHRCEAQPIYGADLCSTMDKFVGSSRYLEHSSWQTRGFTNRCMAMKRNDDWSLQRMIQSYETRCEQLREVFRNFVIYVPPACANRVQFFAQNLVSPRLQREREIETAVTKTMAPKLHLLHPIMSAMATQFPDPRLIQYDCGKLQTLDTLLRRLKSEQHRVLIFTQMTKMLDVLESFLNYHGHIYLRLDGSTRVEQRQVLMERFNADVRIFCFILSTRSGGVGINLTGADTVIFYDSDWNPTMDAQAQDRCHRIGQTRDVNIYRLISEKTIEVNILRKANQKRLLTDMAIEGGNFTASYFKTSTIKDLFNLEQNELDIGASSSSQEKAVASTIEAADSEKQSLRAYENALAAAEDEQDVQATKTVKAEVAADLAEFDESIPIDEAAPEAAGGTTEMSKADLEMQNIVKQLSPIERYALRFVEETGAAWTAQQLRAAEEEIEAQKREWEANRLAAMQKEEEMLNQEAEADEMLTYSRKDANNQIWISDNTMERMPMWCPPTPPQNSDDIYIDLSLSFLYDVEPMSEAELPPVYTRKECKRSRSEAGYHLDANRRPPKIRREESVVAPRSLFDRPSAAIARIRRDLKNQRYRGVFKPNVQIPGLKQQIPQKPLIEPEGMTDWSIFEDIMILHVLVNLQGLPCNLMLLSPGHTPNWDLVADIVNGSAKTYRSPKQCRWRYEAVIQPREEGKLQESPKKPKKLKSALKSEFLKGPLRCLRTTQMYTSDNNMAFTKIMRSRFDCIKTAYLKKAPPPKRHFSTPSLMNPKHMEVLQEFGVTNYDVPITPVNIARMRANKLREKQRGQLPPPPMPVSGTSQPASTVQLQQQQQQQQIAQTHTIQDAQQQGGGNTGLYTQQLQIQHIPNVGMAQQSTATAIVLQHAPALQGQHQHHAATTSVTNAPQTQPQLVRSAVGNHPANTTQIVKAIVTPQSGILTAGQMQQLTQQAQHVQLQQSTGGGMVPTPTSCVSVVLSTPVQTLSSSVQASQHHTVSSSTAQIVSIPTQTIASSAPQVGSIVQTLPSQSMAQVVSVSQIANVLTSTANLQPSSGVTTLNTSALRAQRIVAATSSTLQDVVLQQRAGNPSPTIVSVSGLAQGVTPAQFQAAQLRLATMAGGTQQVMTKGIPVSTLQQSNKLGSTAAGGSQAGHIQLYRQRQPVKVLPATTAPGNPTMVQTANGQTTLVNAAGTIIQGSLVPAASGPATVQVQGQKVSVATSAANVGAPSGVVTSVATMQVTHSQGRTQFIKQVGGKQTLARQVGDNDILLVKRQIIGGQKAQVQLQQGQIFATTSGGASGMQLQQQNTLTAGVQQQQQGQTQQVTTQQIATLVKTSSAPATSSTNAAMSQSQGTVNMALSHIKPGGQIKVTMANQSHMRQLHMQQHPNMPRKISRMTQITGGGAGNVGAVVGAAGQQITTSMSQTSTGGVVTTQKAGGGVQTQMVHIQNAKSLPSSVTVQQIQQVMRQGQGGALAGTGLLVGKTSVGRVIPVSVASQSNQRQTIQVVSAASAQALAAAGNIRAHVAGGQNIAGAIKGGQTQTQQAIITAIHQQAQQSHRQNASPVRLQTTASGNLVAVVQQQALQQQQQQQQQQQSVPSTGTAGGTSAANATQAEIMTITQTTAGSSTQQQQQTAQHNTVRTLVKKKIMQFRGEKE